jgi:polyhydroxybutyrate depolymerase
VIAWIVGVVGALAVLVIVAWWWVYAPQPRELALAARVVRGEVVVDGRERTYTAVVPDSLPRDAPVVLVFHGAGSEGAMMRIFTGYRFDELAVERGFVAIYPDGYQGTWNDCRLMSPYPAHTENVDDEGFVAAIVAASATTLGTSAERVFAAGLSNGGHFALRLATGRPDLVWRVAAFAAGYPAPENNGCTFSGVPVATMFVLGTADRINPFRGGMAGAFGRKLGTVLSARDSAAAIAERNGITAAPVREPFTNSAATGITDTTRVTYPDDTAPVILFEIRGGGHVVPNPAYRMPRFLGATSRHLDGPLAAVDFFLG